MNDKYSEEEYISDEKWKKLDDDKRQQKVADSIKSLLAVSGVNSLIRKNNTNDLYDLGIGGDVDTRSGRIKIGSECSSNFDEVRVLNSDPFVVGSNLVIGSGLKCDIDSNGLKCKLIDDFRAGPKEKIKDNTSSKLQLCKKIEMVDQEQYMHIR